MKYLPLLCLLLLAACEQSHPSAALGIHPTEASADSMPSSDRPDFIGAVTMEAYNKLTTGLSYEQAALILGGDGTELSSSAFGGLKTVMYRWKGQGMGNMNAMFQNDKLVSKGQFGLK